jgi:hypothetical protein
MRKKVVFNGSSAGVGMIVVGGKNNSGHAITLILYGGVMANFGGIVKA